MSRILNYLNGQTRFMLDAIETLVQAESPSSDKELVDQCGCIIQNLFHTHLNTHAEVFPQKNVGNHLKFTFGTGEKNILIIGHMDTVWDKGILSYKIQNNHAYGPGIFDMKSGIIQVLWAMKALRELGIEVDKKITFLITTDEEIGSDSSRELIEKEARKSNVVLIPEPSEKGSLKTSRKGLGQYQLIVKGIASHAGNNHDEGVSAIQELAHQIIYLNNLTDYNLGTTVNVGKISGGSRSNVIPDLASAEIDVRVTSKSEVHRIEGLIRNLKSVDKSASVEISGGMNKPPMERTKDTEILFNLARDIAERLGFDLKEKAVGGAGDGNYTANLGIPTLDGLGAVGDGNHARHEHILIDQLPIRSALFAHLLIEI